MPRAKKTTPIEEIEEPTIINKNPSSLRELLDEAKRKAFKKVVVTISSNDKRDSDVTSTIYATCENKYFSVAKILPLDIPVEVEQCLVDTLEEKKILIHVPEMKDKKRTGNSVPKMVKKYNIRYEK